MSPEPDPVFDDSLVGLFFGLSDPEESDDLPESEDLSDDLESDDLESEDLSDDLESDDLPESDPAEALSEVDDVLVGRLSVL